MAEKVKTERLSQEKVSLRYPKRYQVFMHNDDYTTQDFVVHVLENYFHKPHSEAIVLMMTVHRKGVALVGVYSKDLAETKVHTVQRYARENGMPLKLSIQPEN